MENDSEQPKSPRKPGLFDSLMAKVLILIIFALMMGMCTLKYMS